MKKEPLKVSKPLLRAASLALGITVTFSLLSARADAQSFRDIHDFSGTADGANPLNGLILSSTGVMYGTSNAGGAYDKGTVFEVNSAGDVTLLHSFEGGEDGANPQSFLIEDKAGNLYGTTSAGGAHGDGTVFRIKGTDKVALYSFGARSHDGSNPEAGLTMDGAGNLYGTTTGGGLVGRGTVFMLTPPEKDGDWTEKVLRSFGTGGGEGAAPVGGVTLDPSGNLYGTTSEGGAYGYGTVFQLARASSWAATVLHSFRNLGDGATPYAGLITGPEGSLLGAATDGGSGGGGTVFKLTPKDGKWSFSILVSLPGWGISGSFRNLMLDGSGAIYATTHCDGAHNAGTVYKLTLVDGTWKYTLLYTFKGGDDGRYVFSNLVLSNGKLYGTTNVGGTSGKGVIFEVTP